MEEFRQVLPWTQIAYVNAQLWLNDIQVVITKCDTKKATANVVSLQNEWTKKHWADCVRVGGRYQLHGCWFGIETMSVANNTLTLVPSGPPTEAVQLALRLKEMGATMGTGSPGDENDEDETEEEETTATITVGGETLPFPTTRQLHSYLSKGREETSE